MIKQIPMMLTRTFQLDFKLINRLHETCSSGRYKIKVQPQILAFLNNFWTFVWTRFITKDVVGLFDKSFFIFQEILYVFNIVDYCISINTLWFTIAKHYIWISLLLLLCHFYITWKYN